MFVVMINGDRRVFDRIGTALIFASMTDGDFVGELVAGPR